MTRPTVLDMDLVVVPREATELMINEGGSSTDGIRYAGASMASSVFLGMMNASPYPTAWDDVRKYVEGLEADVKREANLATTYAIDCMDEQKRAEAAEARIAELDKEKHAALTMIAMLEKRLAESEGKE